MKIFGNTIVALGFYLLVSCQSTDDYINSLNVIPDIVFEATGNDEMAGTLKVGTLKNPRSQSFSVAANFEDVNGNMIKYGVVVKSGDGAVKINDEIIDGEVILEDRKSFAALIQYTPAGIDDLGDSEIEIWVEDSFGDRAKASISIDVFSNKGPVCDFVLNKLGVIDPYEYEINSSGSFDKDVEYGGGIEIYHFEIVGVASINSLTPIIKYVFEPGVPYTIRVKVQDNDGEWSDVVETVVSF